jgi:biotin transport system substrate-specific component
MYSTVNNYYKLREDVFNKIQNSNTTSKILMALAMACFTGIMAQIIIPLPWTPIPITGQTFAVLVAGLFLGKKYGVLSQILYIGIGATLIPWYGGMTGGFEILLGSNIGYFVGFVIAAYFIGSITEKYAKSRNFMRMTAVVGIANFALIYIPGLTGLAIWSYITQGIILGPIELIIMGLAPFIIGDIVKIVSTGMISKIFLPKN